MKQVYPSSGGDKLKSIIFSMICFALGFAVFYRISSKVEDISTQRDPASLHDQLNSLVGLPTQSLTQDLMQKMKVITLQNGHEKAIVFQGVSSALCHEYKTVVLEFSGEGVTVAGEPTTMKISAPCVPAQDPAEMASIKIPIDKIINEKPKDAEFSFSGFQSKFQFKHAADEWPKTWVLTSIEFKSENKESRQVTFNSQRPGENLSAQTARPLVLEF